MATASASTSAAPYLSNLAHALSDLFRAVFMLKPGEFGARLLQELRRSAALDAGQKF